MLAREHTPDRADIVVDGTTGASARLYRVPLSSRHRLQPRGPGRA